jgi:adenosylcobinamide-GDP ribazoletransferase
MIKSFALILTFLTRIPIRINGDIKNEDFARGIVLIPLVGLLIGFFMAAIFYTHNWFKMPVVSLIIWVFYIWLTGGLHIDGLADTFDGVFSNRSKERILEIMKDSRIGTFGVLAIFILFISNIVLTTYVNIFIIMLTPFIGRCCTLMTCSISDYAKDKGMGKSFIDYCGVKELIVSVIYPCIIIGTLYLLNRVDIFIIVPVVITYMFTIMFVKYINNKIGGMTGDTIGSVIEITQCVFLFSAYIVGELL